ncbi:hypothetical protein [Bradyrhizobium semiaridum]|uniref:hypothetical protein n=1 Tax=Bradyrhizobium semiaridum TaxID=2821404 RepID=UPI0024C0A5BD|nr:hypothetical protein [Bradyrhizobium semiaridum]
MGDVIIRMIVMRMMFMCLILGMHVVVVVSLVLMTFVGDHVVIVGLGADRLLECFVGFRLRIARAFDHLALHAIAMAAATGIAVARAAAVTTVFLLLLGLAVGTLFGLDQRLTVGDRDLVIVGMDFAEGEEAVPVAAILDEGGLQRRLYARHLGEVDIAAQLLALGGLEIKLFDAIATDHDDPGLFRVGGIDQHLVGHFGALDGGGHGAWRAQIAPPADATVHLIRG